MQSGFGCLAMYSGANSSTNVQRGTRTATCSSTANFSVPSEWRSLSFINPGKITQPLVHRDRDSVDPEMSLR